MFCTAADWPQFRGPSGAAVSPEADLPAGFSATSGVRWKVALPGKGVSSPVVAGGRVYVTCSSGPRDDRLHVLAFDPTTGARLWHRQLAATGSTACHPDTNMAAPTPVADAAGVVALFATGDLAAFDRDGTLRWYRSLVGDYPTVSNQVGMAASPVPAGDKVILPLDNAGESFVAAVDARTGANVWKVPRPRDINWVTPAVRGDEVIVPGTREVVAYDLATGARRWAAAVGGSGIPSPTVAGDLVLVPARGAVALTLAGGKPAEAWKAVGLGGGMSSPVVYRGKAYAVTGSGVVTSADLKTGRKVGDGLRLKGKFSASPVAGDGKVFFLNEDGVLTAVTAGPELEVLAESPTGEVRPGTPAIAGGALFVRGQTSLICIGK